MNTESRKRFRVTVGKVILCVFAIILQSCVSDIKRIESAKKASWPENAVHWPLEQVRKSLCIVSYSTQSKQRIIGSGVAISPDGLVLTSSHFIRAVAADFGQKVYGADNSAFTPTQHENYNRKLRNLEEGEKPFLNIDVRYQDKTYNRCRLAGYHSGFDIALLKFEGESSDFMSVVPRAKLGGYLEVGLLGIAGGHEPIAAFGKIVGPYSTSTLNSFDITSSCGDSGAPIFSKHGVLIGILTHGEYGELVSTSCLAAPIYSELIEGMQKKTR